MSKNMLFIFACEKFLCQECENLSKHWFLPFLYLKYKILIQLSALHLWNLSIQTNPTIKLRRHLNSTLPTQKGTFTLNNTISAIP